ncbi:MAG: membrane integrity-associated transporter subunit PqiC [Thioclava marina]|uniref:ABC-type transport auxiliary lipoprotein component domain-containing protein n=1 Tax=Thioclava marina TaxID=1915077 RepID=A0ABX3MQM0_9RHOB|nr:MULTISPECIES: PqiC family protein [Thioclava]MBC7147087.1 membrane integrity-associated transporter subunit PqiC [Thioclava marina]MBD3801703.1 membrane integrity-associated transporter subunit PqiC [Thioclava sp.]OOY13836.1 hypothetical protein BMG00_08790 [Thioclava marina]OOY29544.1 hypothetical protein BMI90_04710 [Thioclava sp. L04-15]
MKPFQILPLCLLALAACSDPEKIARYPIDPPTAEKALPNRLGRAELREVSMPQYATAQEIAFQTADGALRSNPDNLWADDPSRAFTLSLARQISALSGATVISEPWPLADPPSRRVEVRIEQMLPGADGQLHVAGVYFVTPAGYEGGRDVVRRFDFTVPIADQEPGTIAKAQSAAVTVLARRIAQLD